MTDKFYEELVREVNEDFAARREMRRPYELVWQLNMNFLMGNQFCNVSGKGEIEQDEKYFYWQEREAYNHIAPIMETRIAKLERIRPKMTVMPSSGNEDDIKAAQVSDKILTATEESVNLPQKISQATAWSEICGTAFYKITWDGAKGKKLGVSADGKSVFEGDIDVSVCPPFEIYPDSNVTSTVDECESIIHAKAYSVQEVKDVWGAEVKGKDLRIFALDGANIGGYGYNTTVPNVVSQCKHGQVMVIEKYERPSVKYPNGRLVIVAGDKLLYCGDLPYINRENGERGFPFVRQQSQTVAGCFWGTSIIERLIPIQRSYNAVKNRKHEFLNRISTGVLTVEDGSVDVDNLSEEGLSPGKVLIYRQGSEAPKIMDCGSIPSDFLAEEERLINEFMVISGTSELSRNSATPTNVTSGVALNLLINQDDARLAATSGEIRNAVKETAQMILRLFRQFALTPRFAKIVDDDKSVKSFYFTADDVVSDKVILDTQNEVNDTVSEKRSMMFDLLSRGVFYDKDGKLSESIKLQILKLAGFSNWADAQPLSALHRNRAEEENLILLDRASEPIEIDDDELHLDEHIRFLLTDEGKKLNKEQTDRVLAHIAKHKSKLKEKSSE